MAYTMIDAIAGKPVTSPGPDATMIDDEDEEERRFRLESKVAEVIYRSLTNLLIVDQVIPEIVNPDDFADDLAIDIVSVIEKDDE